MKNVIKPYKKNFDYSYTSGAYTTIELLRARPETVRKVFLHSRFNSSDELTRLCTDINIDVEQNDKVFNRINQKENSYVLGVFSKYNCAISPELPHVVLVNPSDMGNLGTVMRTLVGFGINNLALVTPAADIWNPKTIRASMGAIFRMHFHHYENIGQYMERFPLHHMYSFMPDGRLELRSENLHRDKLYSLVFGNEASGLGDSFKSIGTSVRISQSELIDSLNLSIAVALGAYVFSH